MLRRSLVILVLAAAAAACGDDEDPQGPNPVASEYALEIEGALNESSSGPAYFGADVDENNEPVWMILMGQDTSRHLVLAGRAGSARPGTGSYAVADPTGTEEGWSVIHLLSDGDELLGMFFAESGTVTISASSAEEVRGTIEFEAMGLMGTTLDTIQVSGSFRAIPAPAGSASLMAGVR